MRKLILILVFLQFLFVSALNAQSISVNPAGSAASSYGAEQLLTDILLDGGACSSSSNFVLKDNPSEPFPSANRSWGYFTKGNSNFPFSEGIVLTSGYAVEAQGPNSGIVSSGDTNWTGDADASYLALIQTNNATVFEFDFVPQGNQISFNYIFASEEYPDYACTTFNDVFAFIISGPGITNDPGLSGKNIALLPNGNPVTINTVNDQWCGDINYYVGGPFQDIQYGGRTIPLTAQSAVIPGETYHIRLLVADASDTAYDSAVFLEAGSFHLGAVIVDINGMPLDSDLYICGQEEYTLYLNVDTNEYQIQWYLNDVAIPGATDNQLTITESGNYKAEISSGDCSTSTSINVTFGELQTNGDAFSLEEIDIDGNGTEIFNLTEAQPLILDDPSIATFQYFETLENAENQTNPIATPTAFPAVDNTVVWARVMSIQGGETCFTIVKITLKVKPNCIYPEAACADDQGFGLNIPFLGDGEIPVSAPPGPNYDCLYNQPYPRFYYFKIAESGNLYFDLNQYTEPDQQGEPIDVDFIVWGPFTEVPCDYTDLQQVVDCSYSSSAFEYVSIENAQEGEFYIMMITNYAGSYGMFGYVNLIFDTENSTGTFDCSIVTGERNYAECDNDNDGQVQFNLNAIANDLIEGNPALTTTFYSNEEDATNDTGNNVIPMGMFTVNVADAPVTIYGQIKDSSGEVIKVWTVILNINAGVVGAYDANIEACDVGLDGVEIFDLTAVSVIDGQEGYLISYYDNEQDAIAGNANVIPNPNAYEAGTTTVFVRIENENGCFAIAKINIVLSTLEVSLGEGFSMCEGEYELTATGNFEGQDGLIFTWSMNGTVIEGANDQTLIITQPATYSVTVENAEGCAGSASVVISTGEAPVITGVSYGPDYIIIEATGGAQPYQYSVTGVVWQSSNQFNFLQPGNYTVFVKSAEGCVVSKEIAIFKIPTMFTPNGDGINDTWNIPGLQIYPGSTAKIYDRTGRLVYQSELTSETIWDGFYMNGQKAPTQDYWYIINVTDGRTFTGHVTVKSRGEKY